MAEDRISRYSTCLVAALLLALAVRLSIWLMTQHDAEAFLQPDSHDYLYLGQQLFENGAFPSFSRTPVYPLFLGMFYSVWSLGIKYLVLIQIGISLCTIYLAWRLGALLFNNVGGWILALILGLDYVSAQGANYLLSESLFTVLVLMSANLAMDIKNRPEGIRVLLCGLFLGLAILCRPIAIFLPIAVALWCIIYRSPGKQQSYIVAAIVILIISSIFAGGWMARNTIKTDEIFLSTISSINLYEYRAAWNVAQRDERPFKDVQQEFRERKKAVQRDQQLNDGALAKWANGEGLRIIIDTPIETVQQGLWGLVRLYGGIFNAAIDDLFVGTRSWQKSAMIILKVLVFAHLILMYLGILGLFRGRWDDHQRALLILCGIMTGYFTLLSIGIEAYARFRIPIMPFLGILSAAGWWSVISRYQTSSHRMG